MSGNEPVILYASAASSYSLLSWQPDSATDSLLLAIPRAAGRKAASVVGHRREEAASRIEELMARSGGVWARVRNTQDSFEIKTNLWTATGYHPPEKLTVIGRGGATREHLLETDAVLKRGEYALLPVDADSQLQLERWIEGLQGMPDDVRFATLKSVVNEGVLDSLRNPAKETALVPEQTSGAPWLWVVLTALLALCAGIAAGFFGPRLLEPKASPQIETKKKGPAPTESKQPQTPADLAAQLSALEDRMSKSSRPVKELAESHASPFAQEPEASQAKRTAEAWMVLKLELLKNGTKIDPHWSKDSNEQAYADFFQQKESLPPSARTAIVAAACFAGSPPAGKIADQNECKVIDWDEAKRTLDDLEKPAAPVPTETPKPNGAEPKSGKKSSDKKTGADKQ